MTVDNTPRPRDVWGGVWEQAIKPLIFSLAIGLMVYTGTKNVPLASAAGLALLGILLTIWSSARGVSR